MTKTPMPVTRGRSISDERCAQCGAAFACGANTPIADGPCWCAGLPTLQMLPDRFPPRCLCPKCLKRMLSVQQRMAAS